MQAADAAIFLFVFEAVSVMVYTREVAWTRNSQVQSEERPDVGRGEKL